jgi:prepilin-type processing-associated H-X9-DG protein/prepilin-type N-terminal cleavage/methylation domain-containing protein
MSCPNTTHPRSDHAPITSRRGVSLIELMFGVSIIAILVALLFPTLGIFREKARTLTCASNLRQIGMGLIAYSVDNRGFYPPGDAKHNDKWSWAYYAWKYFGMTDGSFEEKADRTYLDTTTGVVQPNINIFRCPTTAIKRIIVPSSKIHTPESPAYGPFSYALNTTPLFWMYNITDNYSDDDETFPLRRTMIKHLGATALVMEYGRNTCNPELWFRRVGMVPHRKGGNILFHDGHVEWKKFEDMPGHNGTGSSAPSDPAGWTHTLWTGKD